MAPKITYVTDANGQVLMRKKKKRKKHSVFGQTQHGKKIVLIVLGIIVLLALLIFGLFKYGE